MTNEVSSSKSDILHDFRKFVDLIESRALACDGPVTPFLEELQAASQEEKDRFTSILAALYRDTSPVNVTGTIPTVCDGKEQYAFEAWAASERYDMHQHPMHYLFMDKNTDAARQGWKAALQYVREVVGGPR